MVAEEERIIYDVTEGIPSPETRKKYAYHFNRFLVHFDGVTPEVLLQKDVRVIEAMIIQWIKYLSETLKQRHGTIHHEVAAVLHFFAWNDVRLNTTKVNRSIPPDTVRRKDRHYSHEEIEAMLLHCGGGGGIERNRVIILLMASTGMRLGALSGLRFEDFTPVPEYGIYKTQVYTRTLDEYYTFCTPECKEALDAYRSFRESHDETIVKDYLRHVVKSHGMDRISWAF